jgi:hypothetical protein
LPNLDSPDPGELAPAENAAALDKLFGLLLEWLDEVEQSRLKMNVRLSQRRAMSREAEDDYDLGLVHRDRCPVPDRAWRRGGAGLESALAQFEGGHA